MSVEDVSDMRECRRKTEGEETVQYTMTMSESMRETMRELLPTCRSDAERARILIGFGIERMQHSDSGDREVGQALTRAINEGAEVTIEINHAGGNTKPETN